MKKTLITLVCISALGTTSYLGYEHLKSTKEVDKDIQVASTADSDENGDNSDVSDSSSDDQDIEKTSSDTEESKEDNTEQVSSEQTNDSSNQKHDDSEIDPAKNGLPASHTYHLTAKDGTTVYCSYDPSKKQFVENVRNGEKPRVFAIGGKEIN